MDNDYRLSDNHWKVEEFAQRMETKQWKYHLLNHDDTLFYNGKARQLVAKDLGFGVVAVSKKPLEEKNG